MKYFIVGFIVWIFCGCASVGVTKLKSATAKNKYCELDVYLSEDEIKKPHEVLCLLDSKTGGSAGTNKTIAGAIEVGKWAACRCGADAIVYINGRSEGATLVTWGEGFAVLKAIRYTK